MKPTQEQINESLGEAKIYKEAGPQSYAQEELIVLADAYLAIKSRADLFERQYEELKTHFASTIYPCCLDMLNRHEAERKALQDAP